MSDEVAEKLAEAKKKMFKDLTPSGGKVLILVTGDVKVESKDKKVLVRRVEP